MPSSILGAPTHALLIHLVVVLLPLSAVGALLMCFIPSVAKRFGGLIAVAAVACVPATALAAGAGEDLQHQLPAQTLSQKEMQLLEEHVRLGDSLLPWVIVLAVGALVFVLATTVVRQRATELVSVAAGDRTRDNQSSGLTKATEGLSDHVLRLSRWAGIAITIVGAILATYYVIRIGHLGAEAAWTRVSAATRR